MRVVRSRRLGAGGSAAVEKVKSCRACFCRILLFFVGGAAVAAIRRMKVRRKKAKKPLTTTLW
ncbi:MAG: hypothetical protein MJA29_01585 [Candidatus Omnitrophica bacterium]|nr:hypothetical protein [Candidatus Omnitrophota bacterium]